MAEQKNSEPRYAWARKNLKIRSITLNPFALVGNQQFTVVDCANDPRVSAEVDWSGGVLWIYLHRNDGWIYTTCVSLQQVQSIQWENIPPQPKAAESEGPRAA